MKGYRHDLRRGNQIEITKANIFSIGGDVIKPLGSEVHLPCEYVGGMRGSQRVSKGKRRWYKDNYELSFRKELYLLQNAATEDSGNYTCTITDVQSGRQDKITFQLNIQGKGFLEIFLFLLPRSGDVLGSLGRLFSSYLMVDATYPVG